MKMNDLDALMNVLQLMDQQHNNHNNNHDNEVLQKYRPPNRLAGVSLHDRPAMEWAIEPIQYMRQLGQSQKLPDDLLHRLIVR
jgi:hypothetical protein